MQAQLKLSAAESISAQKDDNAAAANKSITYNTHEELHKKWLGSQMRSL